MNSPYFAKIKKYIKDHTFHFVVLVAFAIMFSMQVMQITIGNVLYLTMTQTYDDFHTYVQNRTTDRAQEKTELFNKMEEQRKQFEGYLDQSELRINSRIDVLDSAIKPEKKRRMLVKQIRDAISENTTQKHDVRTLNNIAVAVIDYSYQYNLPISKVLAQMKVESDFKIDAKSKAGACGLMQIMPQTANYINLELGIRRHMNVWKISDNIQMGVFYMSMQLHNFNNNYDQALMSYNFGEDNLRRHIAGERSLPKETQEYVPRVNKWIEIFKKYGFE